MNVADVAIVGAGPAGAWAAYSLARRGARVMLFDASHPREKPCGGGVTGRALALLGSAIDAAQLPAVMIRRARFVDAATRDTVTVPLDGGATGNRTGDGRARPLSPTSASLLVASRAQLDAALLTAACRAGARLVPARVTGLVLDSDGVRLQTRAGQERARLLIGADGANSLVRRRLARPFARSELSIATGYFADGVTSDEIVIELLAEPPGYIWSFPRPNHLAIGICAQADQRLTSQALRERAAAWIRKTNIADLARLEPYAWPIPSLDAAALRRLDVGGPTWCLVGDAAGLVDPLTREGIFFALQSGAWAADAAMEGDMARYCDRVRDGLVPELTRAARLKSGFFSPAFTGLMVPALQQSAALRAVMADVVAGRQSYAGLKWRLLKTLEWRLAWQMSTAIVMAR